MMRVGDFENMIILQAYLYYENFMHVTAADNAIRASSVSTRKKACYKKKNNIMYANFQGKIPNAWKSK